MYRFVSLNGKHPIFTRNFLPTPEFWDGREKKLERHEYFVFQEERPTPSHWSPSIRDLLDRLLTLAPSARVSCLKELKQASAMRDLDFDKVLNKQIKPRFTPPKDHLNCDPTFELEEMIIETKPLHKKKKRLAKQRSVAFARKSLSYRK